MVYGVPTLLLYIKSVAFKLNVCHQDGRQLSKSPKEQECMPYFQSLHNFGVLNAQNIVKLIAEYECINTGATSIQ